MSEWFHGILGNQQQWADLIVILYIVAIGAVAWVLNRVLLSVGRKMTHRWKDRLMVQLKKGGTLTLWFLGLVFLEEAYKGNETTHTIIIAAQSLIAILLIVRITMQWVPVKNLARLIIYSAVPLVLLNTFGWLDASIETLDSYALSLGNIHITLYDVLRVMYFGIILFWLGRESNRVGKQKIRDQKHIDSSTKEVIAKLFEVGLFLVIALVLLNILGINFATLAVLGGAIGVGIGFGLQSIASNFISGLIILMDRSLSIGDYIELDDGRSGMIRELNLRAVTLETFDGKDIVVPNDVFFTESFTNWTHKNHKQRYAIDFNVAYSTDLDRMFPLVKEMLSAHPKVLSGDAYPFEEQPDIEIAGFGDNGIDLHIEFWMEAIDDGEHRVGGDLLYSLWKLMKEHGFEFPFPQREVRILNKE